MDSDRIIRARAPARISFAGGGTDVLPYVNELGGKVINVAISQFAFASLRSRSDTKIGIESYDFRKTIFFENASELEYNQELDIFKAVIRKIAPKEGGFDLYLRNEVPPGTGLGSSAAAFVALLGVFNHIRKEKKMTDYEIAELAIQLERKELQIPGGKQDQFASVFGGINYLEFENGHTRVNPLRMRKGDLFELEKNLVLVYAPPREKAGGDIIADQIKGVQSRNKHTLDALEEIKGLVDETRFALLRGDLERFGNLLDQSWNAKKLASQYISTPHIDRLYQLAKKHGALGGKLSGAGGGGAMFFYCRSNTEQIVREKLKEAGAIPIPFSFDFKGLQTWSVPDGKYNQG